MATEVMLNTPAVASQIRENKIHQLGSTIQGGLMMGMHTMAWDLRRLVRERKITEETARRYVENVKEFENTI